MIEIQHLLRVVPGSNRPLIDIPRFRIGAGERIGLQGPSGSGKTTLLRQIAMLDPRDSGELKYDGELIDRHSVVSFRRNVVYLPQRAAMLNTTVRENLLLPFRCVSAGDDQFDENRWIELLERLGKPRDLLDQPTETISGGERQIVALLRAVQLDPVILLLDEPTASLDSDSIERFEAVLNDWQQSQVGSRKRAILLASHQSQQIDRMTDRVVQLDQGRIVGEQYDE